MKFLKLTLAALVALWLCGCATPVEQDPFSGTYRFADPGEKGYFVVTSVGPGHWAVQMSAKGGPLVAYPGAEGSPMVVAPPGLLASTFATPMAQAGCLASSGPQAAPLICRVPVDAPYQVAQAMSPNQPLRSATGYILLVGTPAGMLAVDLVRKP